VGLRRTTIGIAALLALTAATPVAAAGSEPPPPAVHLNEVQVMGTHNSYRGEAWWPLRALVAALNYSHAPLDLQLGFEGARKIELDVYADGPSGPLAVRHINGLDTNSTCPLLATCLSIVKAWSDANPSHMPVFVQIEPKEALTDFASYKLSSRYDDLDAEIRSVFPASQLVTPDDVRGAHASVSEAIHSDGWPTVDASRGKVLFFLDSHSGPTTDNYLAGHPELGGRVAFPAGIDGASWAGVFVVNDPVADLSRIQSLVDDGYIVRTRADADTKVDPAQVAAALGSGAQLISTDFPTPGHGERGGYSFRVPGGTPAACNPRNAPPGCTAASIESGLWSEPVQSLSVSLGGQVSYTNAATVAPWTFTLGIPGSTPPYQVEGSATVPSTVSGDATITISAHRFLSLPVFVGSVSVTDPGAGVAARSPVLFAQLARTGVDGVSGSGIWTSTSGPLRTGSLSWSVTSD